ncbi:hypothetical protein OG730_41585 (plasmid) [Streptomyces sp. NBC_01298]|uniref:hypothetical protein n=1 Tax=Streptomyces sp. NBC_01298 TaxID=2903817 RepID=UPI002E1416F3|nr:hypothetical protein OG730_41585 [Streptomyces sp. NBC_01298]
MPSPGAAPAHHLGPGETDTAPRLWWCKDDGTYLRSNGRYPVQTRDEDGRLFPVVSPTADRALTPRPPSAATAAASPSN